jgi:hypothetical protein
MEEKFFDKLAMTLAAPLSRRRMLKAAVVSTVGGVFLGRGFGQSEPAFAIANCSPMGAPCGSNRACNGTCLPCCGGICRFGKCVCPPGQVQCVTEAANYALNGTCTICCPRGLVCNDGMCVCTETLEPPCGTDNAGNPVCCKANQTCTQNCGCCNTSIRTCTQTGPNTYACVCKNNGVSCSDGTCCPRGKVCCRTGCC